jgi:hypothetical protein
VTTWRVLKWSWIVVFLVAVGLFLFLKAERLGFGIAGGFGVALGLCLVLNVGGAATGALQEMTAGRRGSWPQSMQKVGYLRLFGGFFAAICAVILFMAVTDAGAFST